MNNVGLFSHTHIYVKTSIFTFSIQNKFSLKERNKENQLRTLNAATNTIRFQ